jgi:glycosyltransferase involved in cell wall biosynthesis
VLNILFAVLPHTGNPSGGNLYNRQILKKLEDEISITPVSSENDVGDIRSFQGLLVDTIMLTRLDLLSPILHRCRTLPVCMLTHWLPWLEREYLVREGLGQFTEFDAVQGASMKETARGLSRFIVPSNFCAGEIGNITRGKPAICTAPPGIGPVPSGPPRKNGKIRFVSAANWIPVKGLHILLPVLATFTHADWEWDLIGESRMGTPYSRYLAGLIEKSPVRNRIILRGPVEHNRLVSELSGYTCALVPSVLETFGIFAAEARAAGIGCIASGRGGLPESADGIFCSTPADWEKAVGRVLQNPRKYRTVSVKRFPAWEETADKVREFLKDQFA